MLSSEMLSILFFLPFVFSDLSDDSKCSLVERRSPSGVITSPNYPSGYPDNTSCKWLIIYPRNATLVIRVTDIDIEDDRDCESPPCCTHNWLTLETKPICGRNITSFSISLINEETKIKFHTSKGYRLGRGFRLVYHVCKEGQFQCVDNHSCVDKNLVCDEQDHCADGSDEWNCKNMDCVDSIACNTNYPGLSGQVCYTPAQRCDGIPHCPDHSDEMGCFKPVEENKFCCANSGGCVDDLYVCNGENDCVDGSDEANCVKNSIITAVVMGSLACGMIAVLGAAMGWRYYYTRCALPAVISVDGGGGYRRQTDQEPLDEASLYHLYREPPPSYHEAMRQDGNAPTYCHSTRYMNVGTRRTDANAPAVLPRRERSIRPRPPQPLPKPSHLIKPLEITQTTSHVIAGDQLYPECSINSEQDSVMLELSDNNTSTSGLNTPGQDSDSRSGSPSNTSMSSLISRESQTSCQHLS